MLRPSPYEITQLLRDWRGGDPEAQEELWPVIYAELKSLARPAPLREHLPGLPAELEAITMKCLAKDPDQRYPSARAVAEDLWRYLDGEAVEAHTATFAYRIARVAARKLTAAFAAGALLGLLAGYALFKLLS